MRFQITASWSETVYEQPQPHPRLLAYQSQQNTYAICIYLSISLSLISIHTQSPLNMIDQGVKVTARERRQVEGKGTQGHKAGSLSCTSDQHHDPETLHGSSGFPLAEVESKKT